MSRIERLEKILNGGPNSGNHNPGQGRGVGKPSKKISYEEYVKKFEKSTKTERKELDKKYPEYADKYFDELIGRHLKTLKKEREQKELEEKFKNYENDNSHPHFDLDNMVYEYKDALDITPGEYNGDWNDETKSFEKLKNLKEYYNKVKGIQVKIISMNPADYSHTIIDNDDEHYTSMSAVMDRTSKKGIDMYKEKFNNGERVEIPYIKFNENGKFSGEQEGFHRTLAANEIGDSEVPVAIVTKYYGKQPKLNYGRDITKKVEEYFANKKENNSRINRLVNLENKINNRKSSGNVKLNKTSGNPYHDEKGRFSSSHGQGSGIDKSGKENNATKIYEKYKDRKNPKPKSLSDEERELRVRTIINNAERMGINLDNIKKDDAYKIMKFIGWEGNEIGTVSTEFGLEKISDKEIKDDDYIVFNGTDSKDGFDALRDGGYRSKIIDEDDGPGIYTSEYYDTGLDYTKGQGEIAHEERVTSIKINNSNIISRNDVNKKLRNSNRNFLRNLPDSAVAALAGYDAMWTGNGDKEIVILKPSAAEIIELDEE